VPIPILSLTEAQAFTALRSFLLSALPVGIEVIRAELNRVPEPIGLDFVVMSQLSQPRMATNIEDYDDNVATASIAGTVMTVTEVTRGTLSPGAALSDGTMGQIAAGSVVGQQLTGSTGGAGTYAVSPSQTLAAGTLYAGLTEALVPTEWTVQLDFHGPLSADNAMRAAALFRAEFGVDAFIASGFDVTPLYCGEPHQAPFVNGEQEIEYRWSLDVVMQLNPVIGTSLQFADRLDPVTIEVP
jgi:hypothetical protein